MVLTPPLVTCSCKKQSTGLSNTVQTLEKTQADLQMRLSALQDEHQRDTSQLNNQLDQSTNRTKELQKEVSD